MKKKKKFKLGMMGCWTPLPLDEAARRVIEARENLDHFLPIPVHNSITNLEIALAAIERGIKAPKVKRKKK